MLLDKVHANHGEQELLTTGKVLDTCLVTADNRGNIKYWEIVDQTLKPKWIISAHKDAVTSVEVLNYKGKRYVLSGGVDKNVALHTEEGVCVGCFGRKGTWKLEQIAGQSKQLVPPKMEMKFTSQRIEEEKEVKQEKERRKGLEYEFSGNKKGRITDVAPFKKIDLGKFPVEKIPTNYDDLYFSIFKKKLDKKMKS